MYRFIQKLIFLFLIIEATPVFSQNTDLFINENEVLIYRVKDSDGRIYENKTSYFTYFEGNKRGVGYSHIDKESEWKVLSDNAGHPFSIQYSSGSNCVEFTFDGTGYVQMNGLWKNMEINSKGKFLPNVTVENVLVLKTLDFNSSKKYEFDLIQTEELPRLTAYRMYFEIIGEETVSVKAGTFLCKKVLFTLCDFRSIFYKAYYYISNDANRYIVKIENIPKGGNSELIRIEQQ